MCKKKINTYRRLKFTIIEPLDKERTSFSKIKIVGQQYKMPGFLKHCCDFTGPSL